MARVRFTDDFDYRPPVFGVTIAYKAGWSGSVKKECADQAVAQKKAVRIKPQPRSSEKVTENA
ncbi:hypothetical protein [Agrobacterium tumefaciens]|uniref:hypothetical protein n=1 Tax=Agrobacterium tumefaciens TaxID=358 RepID=UPI00278A1C19|nr:hypothetical protein [Agrobacterium tumefaciens]MDP9788723.1 hypothetical protein [Agrobacterium tumefaciens]